MTTETAAARRAKEAADRERAWAEQWPEARERLRRAHHDIECEHDDDCMGDCTHDADAILSLMQSELLQLQVLQRAFENVQQSLAESLDDGGYPAPDNIHDLLQAVHDALTKPGVGGSAA